MRPEVALWTNASHPFRIVPSLPQNGPDVMRFQVRPPFLFDLNGAAWLQDSASLRRLCGADRLVQPRRSWTSACSGAARLALPQQPTARLTSAAGGTMDTAVPGCGLRRGARHPAPAQESRCPQTFSRASDHSQCPELGCSLLRWSPRRMGDVCAQPLRGR
jgi:hypothetical protein